MYLIFKYIGISMLWNNCIYFLVLILDTELEIINVPNKDYVKFLLITNIDQRREYYKEI